MPALRPLTRDDDFGVVDLMDAAFTDLDRRQRRPPEPFPPRARDLVAARVRHLVGTDPGGAWAAEEAGRLVGAAMALVREGLWGLSLLVVRPDHQAAGVGAELIGRALAHGDGTRGGLILSSDDPRAMRLYHRAGFRLLPAVHARGAPVRRPPLPDGVRAVRWPEDRAAIDSAGRAVRGAGHGSDVAFLLEHGAEVLVHSAGGFVMHRAGEVKLLAAHDEDSATDLLRAAIHSTPPGGVAQVEFIGAGHDWAVGVAADAGLELQSGGAIFARGDTGPLRPYLPSGAYL